MSQDVPTNVIPPFRFRYQRRIAGVMQISTLKYPDAGLGLFIHWGIASVKGINISWSMRDGLNGRPAQITPDNYFAMAKDFNPTNYDPGKWLKAAKEAGFVYVV